MGVRTRQPGRSPSEADEVARIRAVYQERDRARKRSRPIQEAYRRLNAERLAATADILAQRLPEAWPRLLDVGCGTGYDLAHWLASGWPPDRLAGIDLVPDRVAAARLACPGADLKLSEGSTIPFPDASVDVATAVTVFSSILDPAVRRDLFAEMVRIVRPGGIVVVYDFVIRKPTNPHVTGLPLHRLSGLGRPPTGSIRLSPLLQAVALAAAVHPRLADVAMRLAPRTHRLTYWRVPLAPEVGAATSVR